MSHTNMDAKLVAAKQSHESEVKYVCKLFKAPIFTVRAIMYVLGKNGKPCRSRAKIYQELIDKGFKKVPLKKKK